MNKSQQTCFLHEHRCYASKNRDWLEHAAGRIRRRWPKPLSVRLMQFLMLKRISDSWQQWSEKRTWEVLSSSERWDTPGPKVSFICGSHHCLVFFPMAMGDVVPSPVSIPAELWCTVTPEIQLHRCNVCRMCIYYICMTYNNISYTWVNILGLSPNGTGILMNQCPLVTSYEMPRRGVKGPFINFTVTFSYAICPVCPSNQGLPATCFNKNHRDGIRQSTVKSTRCVQCLAQENNMSSNQTTTGTVQ